MGQSQFRKLRNEQPEEPPTMPKPHKVIVRLHRAKAAENETSLEQPRIAVPDAYEELTFDNVSVTQANPNGLVLVSQEQRFIAFFPYGEIRDVVSKDNDVAPSGITQVMLH